MNAIITAFIDAGYYRARISTLSEFDKIVGGLAWALRVFSYDVNIDVFYTDSLDLGQKIALTERLVMLLIAMRCPYRVEPHQIVGLDHENLLPCIQWLLKRCEEVRKGQEAFSRLLALRHYHRVTKTSDSRLRSSWCQVVPVEVLAQITKRSDSTDLAEVFSSGPSQNTSFIESLDEKLRRMESISLVTLPSLFRASNSSAREAKHDSSIEHEDDTSDSERSDRGKQSTSNVHVDQAESRDYVKNDQELHIELDTEILATDQKILNLIRKLDSTPNELEIDQYQRRYIELHQQLVSKNKDVKKLYDLYNCLDSTKFYMMKEINLLDSIAANLDLTTNSANNRNSFIQQMQDIISKIETVRLDFQQRRETLRERCESLNIEYSEFIE